MRSYDSATLVKTPATRSLFSASVTVSKPKWVGRAGSGMAYSGTELLLLLGFCCDWRVVEKDRDIRDSGCKSFEEEVLSDEGIALRRAGRATILDCDD
jgi:hypothetical protein